eukprot:snap_masked-scaffold_12-processed-gene-1.49-mRNA-1 protein AED:1.00 eAED:1.00 QI:0/-1/0/0/-1/1/1/0/551
MEDNGRLIKYYAFAVDRAVEIGTLINDIKDEIEFGKPQRNHLRRRPKSYKRKRYFNNLEKEKTPKERDELARKSKRNIGMWFHSEKYLSMHTYLSKRLVMQSIENSWFDSKLLLPLHPKGKSFSFVNRIQNLDFSWGNKPSKKIKSIKLFSTLMDLSFYKVFCLKINNETDVSQLQSLFSTSCFESFTTLEKNSGKVYFFENILNIPVYLIIRKNETVEFNMQIEILFIVHGLCATEFSTVITGLHLKTCFLCKLSGCNANEIVHKMFTFFGLSSSKKFPMYLKYEESTLSAYSVQRDSLNEIFVLVEFDNYLVKKVVSEIFVKLNQSRACLIGVENDRINHARHSLRYFPFDYPESQWYKKVWDRHVSAELTRIKKTPLSKIGFKISSYQNINALFYPDWKQIKPSSTNLLVIRNLRDLVCEENTLCLIPISITLKSKRQQIKGRKLKLEQVAKIFLIPSKEALEKIEAGDLDQPCVSGFVTSSTGTKHQNNMGTLRATGFIRASEAIFTQLQESARLQCVVSSPFQNSFLLNKKQANIRKPLIADMHII